MERPLHPFLTGFLQQLAEQGGPPLDTLQPLTIREIMNGVLAELYGPPEATAAVENRETPGPGGPVPVRIYRPGTGEPLPAVVFFHGGGWMVGSLDVFDSLMRTIANAAGCAVIGVDYRLAPEHRHPAAVEDALAATRWVADQGAAIGIDPHRVAVAGDSAGGQLAAIVAQQARAAGPRLRLQLLIYPALDLSGHERPSHAAHGSGYLLTNGLMRLCLDTYLGDSVDRADPLVSPLFADDLSRVAPARIISAERDILLDEAAEYVEKLRGAGVAVQHSVLPGTIHAVFGMAGVERTRNGIDEAAAALREALAH